MAIHGHYKELGDKLSLDLRGAPPRVLRHRVILPISGVHRGTVEALRYARALSHDITAVYVSVDPAKAERVSTNAGVFGPTECVWWSSIRRTRVLTEPLPGYIERIAELRQPNETITIVVPQFVARRWWHNLLHAQTAVVLRLALMFRRGVVITSVPYQMTDDED